MTILTDTDANRIAAALVEARRAAGSPAMGMVMTLVVVASEEGAEEAVAAAKEAAREHPSRLLCLILGSARGKARVDAEIRQGTGVTGELAILRLGGKVATHPASVLTPLLLPDSPVVVWWPADAPPDTAADPVGALATRRITDTAFVTSGRTTALARQCACYSPGNTDLAWTRITPWRALLAAAFDQVTTTVSAIEVRSERISPSGELLGAWLADRLGAPVTHTSTAGPGIDGVVLTTRVGEIAVLRTDGERGILRVPGQPDRPVALRHRSLPELLAEELRRLDPDDVYAATVRALDRTKSAKPRTAARSGTGAPSAGRAKRTRKR